MSSIDIANKIFLKFKHSDDLKWPQKKNLEIILERYDLSNHSDAKFMFLYSISSNLKIRSITDVTDSIFKHEIDENFNLEQIRNANLHVDCLRVGPYMLNELHQFSTNLTDTLRQSVNAIEICSEDRFRIIKKYGKEANFKNSLELIKSFPNLLTGRVDYFVSNTYINLQSISDLVQSFGEATKNNKSNSEKHFQELNIHFMSQIQSVTNTLIDLSNVKFSFVVKSQAITGKAKELCVKACETIQIADCIIISSVNYIMFENVYLGEIEDISSYKSFLTNSSIVIHSYSKGDIPTTDYITPRDYIQIMPEKAQDSPFTNKILPFDLNILKLRTPLDIKSPSILCHTLSARLYIYSNNQFSYSLYLLKKLPKGKYSLFISNPKLKKKLKPHLAKQIKAKKITSIEVGTGIQK